MPDIWYEEELIPSAETVNLFKSSVKGPEHDRANRAADEIRGVVRLYEPCFERVVDTKGILTSGKHGAFFQVRLGFEVDIVPTERRASAQFTFALCSAHVVAAASGRIQPSVYDLYPEYLDEGKLREVSVEFGPEIKVGDASASIGKLSTDVSLGRIEPVIAGWKGDGEREPHWELRPQSKTMLGGRHLWMRIQVPDECRGARLAVQVEGDIQTQWGVLPVGPKKRAWSERRTILIQ